MACAVVGADTTADDISFMLPLEMPVTGERDTAVLNDDVKGSFLLPVAVDSSSDENIFFGDKFDVTSSAMTAASEPCRYAAGERDNEIIPKVDKDPTANWKKRTQCNLFSVKEREHTENVHQTLNILDVVHPLHTFFFSKLFLD